MNKNFVETLLGAVVLIVALFFLSYSAEIGEIGKGSEGYTVHADFSQVGTLKTGDDVRISGVKVGTVSNLELRNDTYLARVYMTIDPSVQLPTDTASIVSSEGLLGGTFLALEPGASEDYLDDGGRIMYNQDAQNLEKLLGQFIFSMQENSGDTQAQAQQ